MPSPQTPQAAPAATAPAPTLSQQTAALAKEIATEAKSGADWSESPDTDTAPRETLADANARKGAPAEPTETSDPDDDDEGAEPTEAQTAATAGLSPELDALVKARDLDALAAHLGIDNPEEYFKVKADDFRSIRHERKRAAKERTEFENLKGELRTKYGDPIVARRAFESGDLNAYFETLEKWSGVPHAEVQKAWALHVQGKAAPKLVPKAPESASVAQDAAKVAQLKERITADIAKDPLAGVPGVVDLVFDKMRSGWNNGVRTPVAALKLVAADLAERNKAERAALRKAGVIKGKKEADTVAPTRSVPSPARGSATTQASIGKPGTMQRMTDRELARDVLRGLGKEIWRP